MNQGLPNPQHNLSKSFLATLYAGMFFFVPIEIAPVNALGILAVLFWIAHKNVGTRLKHILRHPITWLSWGYFGLHALSLAWTSDYSWGISMLSRSAIFLLLPILLDTYPKGYEDTHVASFIAGATLAATVTIILYIQHVWINNTPPTFLVDNYRLISPWQSRIIQGPISALAAYIALWLAISNKEYTTKRKLLALSAFFILSINIFALNGRTGIIAYLALLIVAFTLRSNYNRAIALTTSITIATIILAITYNTSEGIRHRIDSTINGLYNQSCHSNQATTLRLNWSINSIRIFLEHPFRGSGIGDFPRELERVSSRHSPSCPTTHHPHNQYAFIAAYLGAPGLAALIALIWGPIFFRIPKQHTYQFIALPLAIFFTIIFFSEDYLWRPNTAALLALFYTLLYSNSYLSET